MYSFWTPYSIFKKWTLFKSETYVSLILDGVRIASSNTIESLMEEDFRLIVNDKEFHVQPPSREKISKVSKSFYSVIR